MSCCAEKMQPIRASACCTPKDTVAQAARVMRESGCGCTPVVEDTTHRKLVGVVTERDVCCGVVADDRLAADVHVDEVMRPASACCGPMDSLQSVRAQLNAQLATSLPVVDSKGQCCGTISSHSLAGA